MAVAEDGILAFLHQVYRLKRTKRTGWLHKGIANGDAESISDHMYRMAMMAMVLPLDAGVNRERCVMMALVHDLAESIVGDITPNCGVSLEDKYRMESEAVEELTKHLDAAASELIKGLWYEFEAKETPEARLMNQLDKLECAIQAVEYEKDHQVKIDDFLEYTQERLHDQSLVCLLKRLQWERDHHNPRE